MARVSTLLLLLVGCPAPDSDCERTDLVDAFLDEDGDGFGTGQPVELCSIERGYSEFRTDCDDSDAAIFPGAEEVCDEIDNDCNGSVDEGFEQQKFFADADSDGFGGQFPAITTCIDPGEGWSTNSDDCNDDNGDINPLAAEVCNGGVDDNCNGLADDEDGDVDNASKTRYYVDSDADGWGNLGRFEDRCAPRAGLVENFVDCNDNDPLVTNRPLNQDLDNDGYGSGIQIPSCPGYPGTADNADDCDDTDPLVNIEKNWYLVGQDLDGDGYATGEPEAFSCFPPPGLNLTPEPGPDCNDGDAFINPDADEICGDDIDQDCSSIDLSCSPETCQVIKTGATNRPSGTYRIFPTGGSGVEVYCDLETDGGGWTLVASTTGTTLNDQGGSYYSDLSTLSPTSGHDTVWNGLRSIVPAIHDLRFACKLASADQDMTVDLSFYAVPWYQTITTGSDGSSCFSQGNGAGDLNPPPARRNNVNGDFLEEGDQWGAGFLEGEDSCFDSGDFTVDFDDRGKDSNQSDGTDWGEDDSSRKCGTSGLGSGLWYIFVREPASTPE